METETVEAPKFNFTAEEFLERLNYVTYPDKRYIRKNTDTMLIASVMRMYAKQEVDNYILAQQSKEVAPVEETYSRNEVLEMMSKFRNELFMASVEDQKQTQTNWKKINPEKYLPEPPINSNQS